MAKIKKEYYEYRLLTRRWNATKQGRNKKREKLCNVCVKQITIGQNYYDGGPNRSCHFNCAPPKKES